MFLKIVCRAFGDSGFEFFLFKQKTAYEMRISDWSSDVCSSDLWFRAELPEWPTIFGQIPRAMICGDLVGGSAGAINVDQFVDQRDAWLEFFKRLEERRVGQECVGRVDLGGCRILNKNKFKSDNSYISFLYIRSSRSFNT